MKKAWKDSLWRGLTRRLLLGFGGVVIVLFVVAALLGVFLTNYSNELQAVHSENYDSVRYCEGMRYALDQVQVIAQLSAPYPTTAQASLEHARADFDANAAAQLGNTTLPGERELTIAAIDAGRGVFDKTQELIKGGTIQAPAGYYRNVIFPQYQDCRSTLSRVSEMNLANLASVNNQVRNALLATRTAVMLLLITGLALSAMFVVLTARGMIRPLLQLTSSVRQIQTGNLDLIVDEHRNDEIGELAQAFNEMAAKLREFRRMDLERLTRTQQTTQAAIDSLPDAVAVLDIAGNIEIANRTAQTHFKLAPGGNIHAIRPDWAVDYLEPVLKTRERILPDGYRSAIQLFDESGERFLLPRAVPMFDARDSLIGVTLVLVEITHLRKADEFKSGLLSAVSHELKTPLTSIRMAIRLLADPRIGGLNERQQTLLAAAKTDSERLVRTVEDILNIGRVEAGRVRLDLADVSAMEIARRAMSTVEAMAAERGISLVTCLPDLTPAVHVDVNLTACALSNLLSNAIKYSPAGARVTIGVSTSGGGVEFRVEDQGPGIPDEFRASVFEKFFRIPVPGGPTGAGLGLSIAREIAQLHGGSIVLATTSNQGSAFVLRLPEAAAQASAIPPAGNRPQVPSTSGL